MSDRIDTTDAGLNTAHALHCGREIDTYVGRDASAILLGLAHFGIAARSPDQSISRHAPDIETVAPEQIALDQRYFGAQSYRSARRRQTSWPGSNYYEVVAGRRLRIAPTGRMQVFQSFALVCGLGEG